MNTTTVQRRIYDPFQAGFCRDPLWVRLYEEIDEILFQKEDLLH